MTSCIRKTIDKYKWLHTFAADCSIDILSAKPQNKPTWNQSMVQQLTNDGNFLSLFLKASPIGLIASTICSWSRTLCIKKLNRATNEPSVCLDFSLCLSSCLIFSQISAFSSVGYRLGTSPALSKLLMSSKNDSCLI